MNTIFNNEVLWSEEWEKRIKERENVTFCSRCVLDETIPSLYFNEHGVCNYCIMQEEMERKYPGGLDGFQKLKELSEEIKQKNKNQRYDVAIGVSGGCDSSYLMHFTVKELGLRPLAVHFDNSWNSNIATDNIKKLTEALDIDLYTHVVSNKEFDDVFLSHLKAGIQDIENPTDLALAATMKEACVKFNIKFIFDGHSLRSEGISPIGWLYMDARYLNDVHKGYGNLKIKTLPQLHLLRQIKWMLFNNIKTIRPLWYLDYNKEDIKNFLSREYKWQWYGGHHLENQTAAFFHSYFFPRRLNIDSRANGYSGLIRSGQLNREEALNKLKEKPVCDLDIVERVKKRLELTSDEFVELMSLPIKTYQDFRSYKRTFKKLRPFFYLMAKLNKIPWSFYEKYCK